MNLIFVLPVILIIVLSAFIVKIAAVALNLTGLSEKRSFFQALSAFTGTGFTTRDSEYVVNHDIRRKIVMVLMILGNAGLVSIISTLMLSFMKSGKNITPVVVNITVILLVILFLIRISSDKRLTRRLTKKIQARLVRSATFTKRPVEEILRLARGYGIAEVLLKSDFPDNGKTLFESSFRQKDIIVLAIERQNEVIPAPKASDKLLANDTLICYGKLDNVSKLISDADSANRKD